MQARLPSLFQVAYRAATVRESVRSCFFHIFLGGPPHTF